MFAQALGQAWCLACREVAVGDTCSLVCGHCAQHWYLAHQCLELLHQNDQVLVFLLHCTLLFLQLDQLFVVCAHAEVQVQLQCLYGGQHLSWVQIFLLCVLACSGLPMLWLQHQCLPLALGHGMSSICPVLLDTTVASPSCSSCLGRHWGWTMLAVLVLCRTAVHCQQARAALAHQAALPHACACSDSSSGLTNSQAPDTSDPPHCCALWPQWEMVAVGPVQPQQDWICLSSCALPSPEEEVSGGADKGWSGPPVPPGH